MGNIVVGVDNMQGGYEDNVPKNIKFLKLDCCDLKKMNEAMHGVEIVYHCAATAHEGLSVFSPFEIGKNNYLASVSVSLLQFQIKLKELFTVHQWLDMELKSIPLQRI